MARSGDARKRTWRFKLNEGAILEVSALNGPTEKQIRRRGRLSLVLGTFVAALMVAAVASADQIDAEADASLVAVPHGLSTAATQAAGQPWRTTSVHRSSTRLRTRDRATTTYLKRQLPVRQLLVPSMSPSPGEGTGWRPRPMPVNQHRSSSAHTSVSRAARFGSRYPRNAVRDDEDDDRRASGHRRKRSDTEPELAESVVWSSGLLSARTMQHLR